MPSNHQKWNPMQIRSNAPHPTLRSTSRLPLPTTNSPQKTSPHGHKQLVRRRNPRINPQLQRTSTGLVNGYQPAYDGTTPNFAADLAFGQQGEQMFATFLQALSDSKYEVKYDRYRNGRMVIETHQNPNNTGWKHSGINVTQAEWWVYLYSLTSFTVISVPRLKKYLRTNQYGDTQRRTFAPNTENPTKGFLIMETEIIKMMTSPEYDPTEN